MKAKTEENAVGQDLFAKLQSFSLHDDAGAVQWPQLFLLLAPRYKDGALVRQEGKMVLSPVGPCYQVTLDCPSEGVVGSLMLSSLVSLLTDIEAAITNGTVIWKQHYKKRRRDLSSVNSVRK